MEVILTGLTAVAIVVALTNVWFELRLAAPPVPSMPWVRKSLVDLVPPGTGLVIELGAGCGGLARCIAKKFPHRPVIGYELSLFPFLCGGFVQLLSGPRNLQIRRKDIFTASLAKAEVVIFYLTPAVLQRLAAKLATDLSDGATIISSSFPLPGWEVEKTVVVDGPWATHIYKYRALRGAGRDSRSYAASDTRNASMSSA